VLRFAVTVASHLVLALCQSTSAVASTHRNSFKQCRVLEQRCKRKVALDRLKTSTNFTNISGGRDQSSLPGCLPAVQQSCLSSRLLISSSSTSGEWTRFPLHFVFLCSAKARRERRYCWRCWQQIRGHAECRRELEQTVALI
jgi:hypothetical protein